jgi:hypothetical protein
MADEEHMHEATSHNQQTVHSRSDNNLAGLIQTQQDMNSHNSMLISTLLKTLDSLNESRNNRHSFDSSGDKVFKQIEKSPKFSGLPQENFEAWILNHKIHLGMHPDLSESVKMTATLLSIGGYARRYQRTKRGLF